MSVFFFRKLSVLAMNWAITGAGSVRNLKGSRAQSFRDRKAGHTYCR